MKKKKLITASCLDFRALAIAAGKAVQDLIENK